MKELPKQYQMDLFTVIANTQPPVAEMNGVEFSAENAYLTGIEIAAIGLLFAKDSKVDPANLVKDVLARVEALGKETFLVEENAFAGMDKNKETLH